MMYLIGLSGKSSKTNDSSVEDFVTKFLPRGARVYPPHHCYSAKVSNIRSEDSMGMYSFLTIPSNGPYRNNREDHPAVEFILEHFINLYKIIKEPIFKKVYKVVEGEWPKKEYAEEGTLEELSRHEISRYADTGQILNYIAQEIKGSKELQEILIRKSLFGNKELRMFTFAAGLELEAENSSGKPMIVTSSLCPRVLTHLFYGPREAIENLVLRSK